ncbi:hypothetical protein ASPVEDRAFT_44616 [Aspergillus versicolor CBS 583.65]|uniref:Granulins domain-containing protein n=1 Tax=Aspergillus versicolor CBS 583.65 TaxID=1036611 RepID=A0A1L9PUC4_ASPVE|nr:uncharacterized protein ASPVEDRAFT_44616 [Aspergillus versicolor CBS 583.65]OJJ05073.1 hypothetical protein ASPVEDRAFT_44616 [Aspergillus versicolor CBS 583.65]
MYASIIALGSLLAAQAVVADNNMPVHRVLSKRQDQSFVPPTTPGCPSDWPMCGTSNICYDPTRGDTCCPDGTWACPGGNFCLQQGRCCPDGIDPETCAENEGITLTSSTSEPTSAPEPTETTSSTSSRPVIPTGTTETPTGTPTGTPPASSSPAPPEFTGGANAHLVGGAAAVLGGLGMIGNLVL